MKSFELNAIDRHFADFIDGMGVSCASLKLAAALLSNVTGGGNICLNLNDISGREISIDGTKTAVPALTELLAALRSAKTVGAPGDFTPLILDERGRLYLYRYWKYERDLAQIIRCKAAVPAEVMDESLLAEGLARLFPATTAGEIDWQKVAALAALRKRFCIISGGPGTGKTSTVVKILALLLEQSAGEPPRIALAAPTGKSAARLKESVTAMKESLNCADSIRQLIPSQVTTIHRLLGSIFGSTRFRHSPENPLPFDVVIVDEASMVSLPLMAKLATALTEQARFILLGDRDQLASVETGAVLGDICGGGQQEYFSPQFSAQASGLAHVTMPAPVDGGQLPPLTDAVVILKKNYRFRADSGIGALGRAVNEGRGAEAMGLLKDNAFSDVIWRALPAPETFRKTLEQAICEGYRPCLTSATPSEALAKFDAFRVLCALRQGPWGVAGINETIEKILAEMGLIDPRNQWYRGRPLLVTVNDYQLKLFNGDIGIIFPDQHGGGLPRVYFPAPDGGIRSFSPLHLPAHETVYAMTIHKSQGSEFERLLLMLPDRDSDVLTRELLYTGLTRARSGVELWGSEDVFMAAVSRRVERTSGLKDALWPDC